MEEKKEKEEKLKENDPLYRLNNMIDKKQHHAKMVMKEEVKKEKARKVKLNFKKEVAKAEVEDFMGETEKSPSVRRNLIRMNTIRDHFQTAIKKRCKTATMNSKLKSRNKELRSRNLIQLLNTDNKEVNIELSLQLENTRIRVRAPVALTSSRNFKGVR